MANSTNGLLKHRTCRTTCNQQRKTYINQRLTGCTRNLQAARLNLLEALQLDIKRRSVVGNGTNGIDGVIVKNTVLCGNPL